MTVTRSQPQPLLRAGAADWSSGPLKLIQTVAYAGR